MSGAETQHKHEATCASPTPAYWASFSEIAERSGAVASLRRSGDGTDYFLYEAGPRDAPPLILVSPAESPFLLIAPLFAELARTHRVLAWDCLAAPFMGSAQPASAATATGMAQQLKDIQHTCDARNAHVVSWCAGAVIVVWAHALGMLSAKSVSMIAPPGLLSRDRTKTFLQGIFLPLVLRFAVAGAAERVQLGRRIRAMAGGHPQETATDRDIAALAGIAIQKDEALSRYAWLIREMSSTLPPAAPTTGACDHADWLDDLAARVPFQLIQCRDDEFVDIACAQDVARRNQKVRLVVHPTGGHFVIHSDPCRMAADVCSFVGEVEAGNG